MRAREKLNNAFITGSLTIAGLIGYATGSWTVFVIAAVVLLAMALHDGGIRPGK